MASAFHRYTKVETVNLPPQTTTRKLSVNTQKSSRPPIPQRNSATSIPSAEVILEHSGSGRRFSETIQVLADTPPSNNSPPGSDPGRQLSPRRPFVIYRTSSRLIPPLSHAFIATALLIANVSQVRNFLNAPRDEHSFWDYVIWGLCVAISCQILAAVLLILSYISYLKCAEQREVVVPNHRQSPSRCFKLARALESLYLILAFLIMALNIFTALFIEKDDGLGDKSGDLELHSLFYPSTAVPITQRTTTRLLSWEGIEYPTARPFWVGSTLSTLETTTNIIAAVNFSDIQEE
ncbi:hypothetical protein RvY_08321 [Ramazzottius varieornatus]|uniref:Uncharacterized protein n=1 Tax=Ramazzottius varieornatus TaxID=947166 RepID=A0A1D1VB52_RAMVA|nr:hypothetical protein RvY_08321 [Ramazzottius varieornatus]